MPFCMQAIDAATSADAAVALQYFFANIARVAAHAPFFHAPCRTKGHAAFGHFEIAPTTQIAAIGPLGQGVPVGPAAGRCSFGTHSERVPSKNSKNGT